MQKQNVSLCHDCISSSGQLFRLETFVQKIISHVTHHSSGWNFSGCCFRGFEWSEMMTIILKNSALCMIFWKRSSSRYILPSHTLDDSNIVVTKKPAQRSKVSLYRCSS